MKISEEKLLPENDGVNQEYKSLRVSLKNKETKMFYRWYATPESLTF